MRTARLIGCCATVLALAAGTASAHVPGGWLTKEVVEGEAATPAIPKLRCRGVGLATEVTQGSYDGFGGAAAVMHRHFDCVGRDVRRGTTWRVCVHVLANGSLVRRQTRFTAKRCAF